jgi:RNA polymerase sigma-70 factor (ECF subfamily)
MLSMGPVQTRAELTSAIDPLDAWIRRHQAGPWRFLRLAGCPADVADDLVQDAMLAALHKRIYERPDGVASAWLRGAVTNLWHMHMRARRRRARLGDLALAAKALTQCGAEDGGESWILALRACLQQLDGRARMAMELRYGRGASRAAIAEALQLRPQGIKTLLRRVRDSLRRCVLRRLGVERGGIA